MSSDLFPKKQASTDAAPAQAAEPLGTAPALGAVDIQIVFTNHATRQDAERLAPAIAGCDVYIPEQASWDTARREVWQAVADGAMTPAQALEHEAERGKPFLWKEFIAELLTQLYATGKIIALVDVPGGHEAYDGLIGLYASNPIEESLVDWRAPLATSKSKAQAYFEAEFNLHARREQHILEGLQQVIAFAAESTSPGAPNMKICMTIGIYHQNLAAGLRSLASANVASELAVAEEEASSLLGPQTRSHSVAEVKDIMSYVRAYEGKAALDALLTPYLAFDLLHNKALSPVAVSACCDLLGVESAEWAEVVRGYRAGKFGEDRVSQCCERIRELVAV